MVTALDDDNGDYGRVTYSVFSDTGNNHCEFRGKCCTELEEKAQTFLMKIPISNQPKSTASEHFR